MRIVMEKSVNALRKIQSYVEVRDGKIKIKKEYENDERIAGLYSEWKNALAEESRDFE